MREQLSERYDRHLIKIYRGWHSLEKQQHNNPVIDFDLAPPAKGYLFSSREEILEVLKEAAEEMQHLRSDFADLIRQRLQASGTYCEALLDQDKPLNEYIRHTLGVPPRMFSEKEIDQARKSLDSLLSDYGLEYKQEYKEDFEKKFRIHNLEKLQANFDYYKDKWLNALSRHLRFSLEDYTIQVRFTREDAYWKNWISGNLQNKKVFLRINIHNRHLWLKGIAESLALHEYCGHAVQIIQWHRQCLKKKIPGFLGILTVHFPDQFILEGLAESLIYFLPSSSSSRLEKPTKVFRDLHRLFLLVMNNVHIIADSDPEKAWSYAIRKLPFSNWRVIKKEITARVDDPLFRTYQYVYGIAKEAFLQALRPVSSRRRWEILRRVYHRPMTREEFLRICK